MDPCSTCCRATEPWLPRTRGDGPRRSAAATAAGWASPHTRGWTRWLAKYTGGHEGFPAHAGMDRGPDHGGVSGLRLPRTRGDGPDELLWRLANQRASPHTRGWTPRRRRPAGHAGGFPAHAGMDPLSPELRTGATWLPRTRGDGPARTDCERVHPAPDDATAPRPQHQRPRRCARCR